MHTEVMNILPQWISPLKTYQPMRRVAKDSFCITHSYLLEAFIFAGVYRNIGSPYVRFCLSILCALQLDILSVHVHAYELLHLHLALINFKTKINFTKELLSFIMSQHLLVRICVIFHFIIQNVRVLAQIKVNSELQDDDMYYSFSGQSSHLVMWSQKTRILRFFVLHLKM